MVRLLLPSSSPDPSIFTCAFHIQLSPFSTYSNEFHQLINATNDDHTRISCRTFERLSTESHQMTVQGEWSPSFPHVEDAYSHSWRFFPTTALCTQSLSMGEKMDIEKIKLILFSFCHINLKNKIIIKKTNRLCFYTGVIVSCYMPVLASGM